MHTGWRDISGEIPSRQLKLQSPVQGYSYGTGYLGGNVGLDTLLLPSSFKDSWNLQQASRH